VIVSACRLRVLCGAEVYDTTFRPDELVWVDFVDPHGRDIDWLERTFGFHRLALEDVVRRHQRPKLDAYPGYCFGVLYAVRAPLERRRVYESELQFFWGPRYLVTLHTEPFPEIGDLAAKGREGLLEPVANSERRGLAIADLVYQLIDAVVDGYFPAVDALAEWTEDLEEQMFSASRGPSVLQGMFSLRRDLIHLRKVIAPSREVINTLLRRDQHLFGPELYAYFQDVYDHTVRVIDSLDTYRDVLGSALDTYLSVMSNDVNRTVKRMTALTAILMVASLIAGIYGMNFEHMPELSWYYGYAWALGLMLTAAGVLWRVFKHIDWL
jgi:magnesium transporter